MPSTSTFTVPSGSLSSWSTRGERADRDRSCRAADRRRRVLLGGQQNVLVGAHHLLERADGLLAADEERHDHVREDDDVAQRQDGVQPRRPTGAGRTRLVVMVILCRSFLARSAAGGGRRPELRAAVGRQPTCYAESRDASGAGA